MFLAYSFSRSKSIFATSFPPPPQNLESHGLANGTSFNVGTVLGRLGTGNCERVIFFFCAEMQLTWLRISALAMDSRDCSACATIFFYSFFFFYFVYFLSIFACFLSIFPIFPIFPISSHFPQFSWFFQHQIPHFSPQLRPNMRLIFSTWLIPAQMRNVCAEPSCAVLKFPTSLFQRGG